MLEHALFALEENCSLKAVRFVRDGTKAIVVAIKRRSCFGVQTEHT